MDDSSTERAGALIRKAREERRLLVRELAASSGVSAATISAVERGRRAVTLDLADRILAAMGLRLHVETEPEWAAVDAAIEKSARVPLAERLKDWPTDVTAYLTYLDGIPYLVDGMAAAAMQGVPVPVEALAIAVPRDDDVLDKLTVVLSDMSVKRGQGFQLRDPREPGSPRYWHPMHGALVLRLTERYEPVLWADIDPLPEPWFGLIDSNWQQRQPLARARVALTSLDEIEAADGSARRLIQRARDRLRARGSRLAGDEDGERLAAVRTYGLRFDVNCSILFTELPPLRRPAAARAAGFDAVEFWWPFASPVPGDQDVDAFTTALADAGVRLALLNFAAGDMAAGERGLMALPEGSAAFRDNIDVCVGIAARTGCTVLNALYGNRVDGISERQQDQLAAENLALAARAAARAGATVVVEAINSYDNPRAILVSSRRVLDLVALVRSAAGLANVAFLADLYHLARMGEDLTGTLAGHARDIGHIQIADVPGRGAPGTGTLDYEALFRQLADQGYAGWIGCEYLPSDPADSSTSFSWGAASAGDRAREV
jgi:hydroxypyruvate isomerase